MRQTVGFRSFHKRPKPIKVPLNPTYSKIEKTNTCKERILLGRLQRPNTEPPHHLLAYRLGSGPSEKFAYEQYANRAKPCPNPTGWQEVNEATRQ